jgi:hypothetical protein
MGKNANRKLPDMPALMGEVMEWVSGKGEKPQHVRQMGDDFPQKLNWYVAQAVLSQFERLPLLLKAQGKLADRVWEDGTVDAVEPQDVYAAYCNVSREIATVTELARKFVVQNREHLLDDANMFDRQVYEKIRAMPPEHLRDYMELFRLVDDFGHTALKEAVRIVKNRAGVKT